MKKLIINKGDVFGRLTILEELSAENNKPRKFLCVCECGKEKEVLLGNLTSKTTVSCGCYGKEKVIESAIKHGLHNHPCYHIWNAMKARCEKSSSYSYKTYGAKGVKVCEEWHNPAIFIKWMEEHGWSKGLQIDRIDNNGNYCPQNCQIISRSENLQPGKKGIYSSNKTGVQGVKWSDRLMKFIAQITINGKRIHLGVFNTLEEARLARLNAEKSIQK